MIKHTRTICRVLPLNCLSAFYHFVGLALKGLSHSVKLCYIAITLIGNDEQTVWVSSKIVCWFSYFWCYYYFDRCCYCFHFMFVFKFHKIFQAIILDTIHSRYNSRIFRCIIFVFMNKELMIKICIFVWASNLTTGKFCEFVEGNCFSETIQSLQ